MIFATKAYRKFVHRLTLYLIISAFCESLMFGVEVIPVTITHDLLSVRTGWEGACAAIGFLAQYSVWCELLFICWITLYLFLLAVFKSNPFTRKHEIAGVTLSVSVPLLFNWVPFLDDMYGRSGAWCWIWFTEGGCDGSYAQLRACLPNWNVVWTIDCYCVYQLHCYIHPCGSNVPGSFLFPFWRKNLPAEPQKSTERSITSFNLSCCFQCFKLLRCGQPHTLCHWNTIARQRTTVFTLDVTFCAVFASHFDHSTRISFPPLHLRTN